jgi:hypothetical protein
MRLWKNVHLASNRYLWRVVLFDRQNPVHFVPADVAGNQERWDALSDRNPEFPNVSLVSSMETCNVCNFALGLETARGRESSDAMLDSSQKGPRRLRWFKKVCRECNRVFYDGWWSNAKSTRGVRGSLIQVAAEPQTGEEVFTSTQYTSFDVAYLVEC